MREFVYGTDLQYKNLKAALEDNKCHIFHDCRFPGSFSRSTGRIGFEKGSGVYRLLIDEGISCSNNTASLILTQCRQWLAAGEYMFLDFNDLKTFLKGLRVLYQ